MNSEVPLWLLEELGLSNGVWEDSGGHLLVRQQAMDGNAPRKTHRVRRALTEDQVKRLEAWAVTLIRRK